MQRASWIRPPRATAHHRHLALTGGSEAETLPFQDTIRSLLPDATITSWDHKPCVVTYTDAELPYIGQVDDRIIVALGASGSGAKSSDELGRLAAALTRSAGWTDSVLDAEQFHIIIDRFFTTNQDGLAEAALLE